MGWAGYKVCSSLCIATLRDLIVVPLPSYYRTKVRLRMYTVLSVFDGGGCMESFWFDV